MPEILWAPWRLKYIEGSKEGGTGDIFLDLPAQNEDRKNLILYRGTSAFVILNAYPYTNGHLMVAPFRQCANVEDLNDDELLEINQLVAASLRWLKKAFGPDGFNVGVNLGSAAGAGIPCHVHWHIVPRWSGDTNFMTTVGDIRVMPQSLEDTYDRLAAIIEG
ncbi:MAG TPA: HIT domain-containing protein [Fimbriimonas sp.]|nr:HIT domain-containing protein [Fimbriimonas sp.]